MLHLLGMLSAVLALLPESSAASSPPGRGNNFRRDRRIPPPDYGLGADAWARERGLEPIWYPVDRPKPRPSWSRLVKDINRRSSKDRARIMIEERVPPEALEWLREMIMTGDWIALRIIGYDRTEDEIRDQAALAAMRWEIERQTAAASDATDDAGAAAPPPAPRPR
ncbi:hypothetical protein ASD54_09570 [Rhizobium sp. Root149]|uniref:hypothetical protein n=1 Tax=Rhizobium sp. Root149 TaxID=1736473 RepID=UPI00071393E8|nr:hypothetical protein [Rhizobium sp. Root149]KQZ50473.1 hypothetical protein ASD54_09570 [Rhizobium sp. Root149]